MNTKTTRRRMISCYAQIINDRAYNNFETLYRQSTRGVVFVVREKEAMLHEVVRSAPKEGLAKNIIADETIRLAGIKTKESIGGVGVVE